METGQTSLSIVSVPIAGISSRKGEKMSGEFVEFYVSVPIAGISSRKDSLAVMVLTAKSSFSPDRRD